MYMILPRWVSKCSVKIVCSAQCKKKYFFRHSPNPNPMPICLAVLQFLGAPVSQVRLVVLLRRVWGLFDPGEKRPLPRRSEPVFIHVVKRIFEAFEWFMSRTTETMDLLVGIVPEIIYPWAPPMRDSVKARAPLSYALFAARRLGALLWPSISAVHTFAHSKFLYKKYTNEEKECRTCCKQVVVVAWACCVVAQKKMYEGKELWSIIICICHMTAVICFFLLACK